LVVRNKCLIFVISKLLIMGKDTAKAKKLTKDITRTKKRLVTKAQKVGLWENFGDDEVRRISDEYDKLSLQYGTQEERTMALEIDVFQRWCYNFDLSQIKEPMYM
jgi:hypothetical protein